MNYNDFSTIYDIACPGVDGDVDFFVNYTKNYSNILEIGTGTGRVYKALQDANICVTGIEPSKGMVDIAKKRIQEGSRLHQVSLEDFITDEKFDLIILPYRVFMHFYTLNEQICALKKLGELLLENGTIIIDLFNPDIKRISAGESFKLHKNQDNKCVWLHEEFDTYNQTIKNIFKVDCLGKDGAIESSSLHNFTARWFYPSEFQLLIKISGFHVINIFSDYYGRKFTGKEDLMIWELKKI